jgi:hypothetical protein
MLARICGMETARFGVCTLRDRANSGIHHRKSTVDTVLASARAGAYVRSTGLETRHYKIHSSPMSSRQISGCAATYLASISMHSLEWASKTSAPFSRSQSMPP